MSSGTPEYGREYRRKNPDKLRRYERTRKRTEGYKARKKEWRRLYNKGPLGREARKRAKRRTTARRKAEIFALLGPRCARCGFSDGRALQIDHIHGDGFKERHRGAQYYGRVLRSVLAKEGRFQVLCANCNWIKREEDFAREDGLERMYELPSPPQQGTLL